ncbi:MAG: DUF3567 domain-containing protein [Betaproteobacteria bacterium]|jgi:Protein of unknown function (DUF3567)|nr:DUF3567 domain-containing protein [Betaproteobacteria bacterium]
MQTIYLSDSFVVVHLLAGAVPADATGVQPEAAVPAPALARHGFEIVDKRHNREVYLDGDWADMFARQIEAWQRNAPTQEEVESTLEGYAVLAQTPLYLH